VGGPIPLHRYRAFKKTRTEQRADRIEALAEELALPRAAVENRPYVAELAAKNSALPVTPFLDPDPFQEFTYRNVVAAKQAIADYLRMPLAKLPPQQLEQIDMLVSTTLDKKKILEGVRQCLSRDIKKAHAE
jgi:hypothetical protein